MEQMPHPYGHIWEWLSAPKHTRWKRQLAMDSVCLVSCEVHVVQLSQGTLSDRNPLFLPGKEGIEALL